MTIGTWHRMAIAGLLAGALTSCAHEEKKTAAPPPPPTAAQRTQQAFQQAATGQQQVAQGQKQLDAAQQEVVKAQQQLAQAQQQLAQAQQREERERANVQQLGIKSRQDLETRDQLAQQEQAAAEQAQGLSSASGRIAEATPSHVLLKTQGGQTMSFQLDQRTKVLVGSEQRKVSDIQQGADARVTYDPKGPGATALTIHVKPVVGREAGQPPASPAAPQPQPPPGP